LKITQLLTSRKTEMKLSKDHLIAEQHDPTTSTNAIGGIRITASVFHIDIAESFYEVQFPTLGGEVKTLRVARELFRIPTKVADALVKAGADLADPVQAVKSAIEALLLNKPPHSESTRRTGWQDGSSFVYPTETFGRLAGQQLYDGLNQINPTLGVANGLLLAWKDGLREPCKFSDYLVFTASVGPASCLLDIIGQDEGALFHLHGTNPTKNANGEKTKSTSGKTMATRTGVSVVGGCKKNDLFSFDITPRAVEDFCCSHNHLVVALDEEGRSSDVAGTSSAKPAFLPYLIAGGRGKVRSNKATQDPNLKNASWALLALSTGEDPLDGPSAIQRPEGAQVRMIGIPVPPGKKGGIFNRFGAAPNQRSKKCKELARQVEQTIAENYGVAMPEYLRMLVPKRPSLVARVRRIIDNFVKKMRADTDPWERRFAEKFGIVLAGAILMSEFGIGPWTKQRARKAIATLYRKARSAIVSVKDATDAFLKRLRELVKAGKRFPLIKKGESYNEADTWGLTRKMPDGSRAVLIPSLRFDRLVKPSAAAKAVLAELEKRGILIKSADGKPTRQMKIEGSKKRRRYVCLNRKALLAE
jgi:hypothetical protein